MSELRCVFCRSPLSSATCVWVQLPDGVDFVCCPTACPPLLAAAEARRRELEAARSAARPVSAA